jgi:batB protein|nr:VWA domain-containing protein [uncultured Porphyromonas sp.]
MNILFYSPEYLYLLFGLIPLALLSLFVFYRRRRLLARFTSSEMQDELMPLASGRRQLLRDLLVLVALGLLIIVLARPQVPGRTSSDSKEDDKGIEAMICLDISNSMLAQDVAPSRLDFAKRTIAKLLEEMPSDKVGLIVFAGSAFVQLPITTDLSTAQEFLAEASPEMLSDQGTAIGEAIALARQSFSDRKDLGKAIIILTDGEDFEGNTLEVTQEATKAGIRIDVVGIGTSSGAPIPTAEGQLTDESGNMVVTKVNQDMCRQIADAGKGIFVSSQSPASAVKAIRKQLDELPRASVNSKLENGNIENFEPWLRAALFLLLLEFFIMGRKNKFLIRHNIFGHEK